MKGTYEIRSVAYLDILGFTKMIEDSVTCADVFDEIIRSVSEMKDIQDSKDDLAIDGGNVDISLFSDNILISSPEGAGPGAVANCAFAAMYLQMSLLTKGILVRGGMTTGQLFHDSNLLFGPALVRAHNIEAKIARYPRIVVDECINSTGSIYTTDFDGDTLGNENMYYGITKNAGIYEIYQGIRTIVDQKLKSPVDLDILSKIRWLDNYCERTFYFEGNSLCFKNQEKVYLPR